MFGCNPQNRISYRTTEVAVDTGIWYHFTGIIYSANNMELYINCNNAVATFSSGTGPINVAYSNFAQGTLGRLDGCNGPPYHNWGYMDDFAYWERGLSPSEIYFLCDSMPLIVIPNSVKEETIKGNRKLIKIIDVLGRETKCNKNEPLFYIFDNGTVEKRMKIE